MHIVVAGDGKVGGGLARRWQRAGHVLTAFGREGGDASNADIVVLAVPSNQIANALGRVTGVAGKVVIDTTNAYAGRNAQYESFTHEVKSIVGGPVAKAFNTNAAVLYDEIDTQRVRPSSLYVAEEEARELTEQLIRDAGYDPVYVGGLERARSLEDFLTEVFAPAMAAGNAAYFYRVAKPSEL